jgi:hypothetical protein
LIARSGCLAWAKPADGDTAQPVSAMMPANTSRRFIAVIPDWRMGWNEIAQAGLSGKQRDDKMRQTAGVSKIACGRIAHLRGPRLVAEPA